MTSFRFLIPLVLSLTVLSACSDKDPKATPPKPSPSPEEGQNQQNQTTPPTDPSVIKTPEVESKIQEASWEGKDDLGRLHSVTLTENGLLTYEIQQEILSPALIFDVHGEGQRANSVLQMGRGKTFLFIEKAVFDRAQIKDNSCFPGETCTAIRNAKMAQAMGLKLDSPEFFVAGIQFHRQIDGSKDLNQGAFRSFGEFTLQEDQPVFVERHRSGPLEATYLKVSPVAYSTKLSIDVEKSRATHVAYRILPRLSRDLSPVKTQFVTVDQAKEAGTFDHLPDGRVIEFQLYRQKEGDVLEAVSAPVQLYFASLLQTFNALPELVSPSDYKGEIQLANLKIKCSDVPGGKQITWTTPGNVEMEVSANWLKAGQVSSHWLPLGHEFEAELTSPYPGDTASSVVFKYKDPQTTEVRRLESTYFYKICAPPVFAPSGEIPTGP